MTKQQFRTAAIKAGFNQEQIDQTITLAESIFQEFESKYYEQVIKQADYVIRGIKDESHQPRKSVLH